jgi:hypothetical protein
MLNRIYSTVYNNTIQKEVLLWKKVEYVLFARLKNHTIVFTKARTEKMDMVNSVKFADSLKIESITKKILKNVLLNMRGGLREIHQKFLRTRELIIIEIKKKFLKSSKRQEKKMDMPQQKHIGQEIGKKLNVTTLSDWLSNLAFLKNPIIARNVKTNVCHKLITMIIQSLWMSFGFVEDVMERSIEYIYQRERPSLWTPKGDAMVRSAEETGRGRV